MKNYSISDHCRWVKGACGSAIYDLAEGSVYSINEEGTAVLQTVLFGNPPPSEALAFLDGLEAKKLINYHQNPIPESHSAPSLRYVWLELTSRCNCKCLHCYGAFGLPKEEALGKELTLDEWKFVIEKVSKLGGNAIQFIGGEPLIHPHFGELLEHASAVGIERIDIFTNAYFITEELADKIAKAGASVRISIYGYDSATHDAITQKPGSFDKLDKGIDILNARNIPVNMAVVLMRENQDILPQIREYIESKGLKFNGFDTVREVMHSPQASHSVTRADIECKRWQCSPDFHTSAQSFADFRRWNSCWMGKFAVTSTGDIIPCIFARDLSCVNIRTDSHDSIKEKLVFLWKITKDSVEGCKDCEYRYACEDCRPLAMGVGGGLNGKYPRCTYSPLTRTWEQFKVNL